MNMPPVPPSPPMPPLRPSSSSDDGHLGIPAISSRMKALEDELLKNLGSVGSPTPQRSTDRVDNSQIRPPRQCPPSLGNLPQLRASSAPPIRKFGAVDLALDPLLPTMNSPSKDTQAKYQEVLKNSGLLYINEQQQNVERDELTQLAPLGQGSCGHVYKVEHKSSKSVLAVKIMYRTASDEENKRIIMDLNVITKSYNFPYIVRCLGYFIYPTEVWICMEVMASCFDKLLKLIKQPIPEPILGKLTFAIVTALDYLKEAHGIIHRDVKPSNILIDELGAIKLCDFGISGVLIESMAKTLSAGCAGYMSPERIEPSDPSRPDYDIRADVWSLGISLIELATGEYPYADCHGDFQVMTRIVAEPAPQLPSSLPFSEEFRSFVKNCLIKDYKERPKYGQLMRHPFFIRSRSQSVDVAGWYRSVTNTH